MDLQTFQPTPGPDPTPVPAPTQPPVPIDDVIPLSDFTITYNIAGGEVPGDESFDEAGDVTALYIEEIIRANFEFSDEISVLSVTTTPLETATAPTEITFATTIEFDPDSLVVPSAGELDVLMATIFQQPTVQTLYLLLRNLPTDNPFSRTDSVGYSREASGADLAPSVFDAGFFSGRTGSGSGSGLSGLGVAAVVGTCVVSLLVAGFLYVRRRSKLARYMPASQLPPDDLMEDGLIEIESTSSQSLSRSSSRELHLYQTRRCLVYRRPQHEPSKWTKTLRLSSTKYQRMSHSRKILCSRAPPSLHRPISSSPRQTRSMLPSPRSHSNGVV